DVMRYKVTPPPTPSNIKSLSFSSPRCGGIEGGARRGLNMYLIRAETPVRYYLTQRRRDAESVFVFGREIFFVVFVEFMEINAGRIFVEVPKVLKTSFEIVD
ncbi:MAG: hypothetical protein ACKO9U_15250, partial [Dolichospermum sp.]